MIFLPGDVLVSTCARFLVVLCLGFSAVSSVSALVSSRVCYLERLWDSRAQLCWCCMEHAVRTLFYPDLSNLDACCAVQLVDALVTQRELALFAASYKLLFLATTMVGLHRLLFQVNVAVENNT